MPEHFTVIQDFHATVAGHRNHYIAGVGYTARDGAKWDDLRSQIPEWEAGGLVRRGRNGGPQSTQPVRASGTVTTGRAS